MAGPLYTLLDNKYYFDRFNDWFFAGGARARRRASCRTVGDRAIIDGFFVNGSARVVGWTAALMRHMQTGYVYHYAFTMIIGVFALLTWWAAGDGRRDDAVSLARHLGADRRRPRGARRRPRPRRRSSRAGSRWSARSPASWSRSRCARSSTPATSAMQFVELRRLDSALRHPLPPRRGRHLDAVRPAEQLHHGAGGVGRLGGDPEARRAVHGRVPDHVGAHQRRVLRARRHAVLRRSSRRC